MGKRHGMTGTKIHETWRGMLNRCSCKKGNRYHRYGGRGIKVCDRWLNSFEAFYEDMGDPPTNRHQIDRIDNNRDYCPENCRWVTAKENCRNRSSNLYIEYEGVNKTVIEWSEDTGILYGTIMSRLRAGWEPERIFNKPVRDNKKLYFNIEGENLNVTGIAKRYNIPRHRIYRLLKKGIKIDSILDRLTK